MADSESVRPDPTAQPAEEAAASDQTRAAADALVPGDFARVQHGISPASLDDFAESLAGLVRAAPVASVIRAFARDSAEQLERERDRADALRDRLAKEQQDRAVATNELKHAGTRTAGQQMLQIVGGAFIGYGLSQLATALGWVLSAIGVAMAVVGSLPVILLPWWRRKP